MSGCKKYLRTNLVKSKTLPIFVVPNVQSGRRNPKDYILYTAPAGLFSGKSDPIRFGRLATIRERLALSVFRHNAKFHSMPNVNEISRKTVQGAVPAKSHPYKVSVHAIRRPSNSRGDYITDIYEATSEDEAIGMACVYIAKNFPTYVIQADRIKCIRYPVVDTLAVAKELGRKITDLIEGKDWTNCEEVRAEMDGYNVACDVDYARHSDGYFDDVDLDLRITNIRAEDADCREYPIQLDPADILVYVPNT